jgi:hypothetical protein
MAAESRKTVWLKRRLRGRDGPDGVEVLRIEDCMEAV